MYAGQHGALGDWWKTAVRDPYQEWFPGEVKESKAFYDTKERELPRALVDPSLATGAVYGEQSTLPLPEDFPTLTGLGAPGEKMHLTSMFKETGPGSYEEYVHDAAQGIEGAIEGVQNIWRLCSGRLESARR